MHQQRGAALLDAKLAIVASILLCIVIISILLQYGRSATLAASVSNAVDVTARAAQHYYARQIETTRCLPASTPSIATLISQGFLRANAVQGQVYSVAINYIQSPANRPVRLDIVVTFPTQELANNAASLLHHASRPLANSLSFSHSILPAHPQGNEWSNFNKTTRCYV